MKQNSIYEEHTCPVCLSECDGPGPEDCPDCNECQAWFQEGALNPAPAYKGSGIIPYQAWVDGKQVDV